MNDFYENLIKKSELKKDQDKDKNRRESELLRIKDERTIPKLRVGPKGKRKGKWKKR